MTSFKISTLLLIKSWTFWYIERLPTASYTGVTYFQKLSSFLAHPVFLLQIVRVYLQPLLHNWPEAAIMPFKVIQVHWFWLILTYIISCTISKLLQIIGQICAFDRGSHFNTLIWGEPLNSGPRKFGLKKLETLLYSAVQKVFWYFEPFRRGSRVWWRTDRRRTDGNDCISNSAV